MLELHPAAAMRIRAALLTIALAFMPEAAEARLEGRSRTEFMQQHFNTCVRASERHPIAKDLPRSIVSSICTCSGNYVADRLAPSDHATVTYGNTAERSEVNMRAREYSRAGQDKCKRTYKAS